MRYLRALDAVRLPALISAHHQPQEITHHEAKHNTQPGPRRAKRKAQKQAGMKRPGGKSRYARKRDWLHAHSMWGFDVPEPKPWRSS